MTLVIVFFVGGGRGWGGGGRGRERGKIADTMNVECRNSQCHI